MILWTNSYPYIDVVSTFFFIENFLQQLPILFNCFAWNDILICLDGSDFYFQLNDGPWNHIVFVREFKEIIEKYRYYRKFQCF